MSTEEVPGLCESEPEDPSDLVGSRTDQELDKTKIGTVLDWFIVSDRLIYESSLEMFIKVSRVQKVSGVQFLWTSFPGQRVSEEYAVASCRGEWTGRRTTTERG